MAQRRTDWHGVFVVSVTPFNDKGEIDEAAFGALMDQFVADGVHGIIVAGSTGEWYTLSDDERLRLFASARARVGGRAKLIAGTSAIATRDAVALTRKAKDMGYDGAMVLAPPYALPNERELLGHFEAIADVGLPLMAYNNPGRTQVTITPALAEKLVKFPAIVALKDSSKDLYALADTLHRIGGEVAVFCGLEPYAAAMIGRGAVGTVSMAANIMGARAVEFWRHLAEARHDQARPLEAAIDRLYEAFYVGGYGAYVVIKACMNLVGRPAGLPRRPHLPVDAAGLEKLRAVLRTIELPIANQPSPPTGERVARQRRAG
ncbi:MAG: dihydrodipicolinate synthase family protein [Alphaproteobacteria bacterium]|nr:dihydrodipicolinate synthase family protein [Alphaproteobacteria bacterium]